MIFTISFVLLLYFPRSFESKNFNSKIKNIIFFFNKKRSENSGRETGGDHPRSRQPSRHSHSSFRDDGVSLSTDPEPVSGTGGGCGCGSDRCMHVCSYCNNSNSNNNTFLPFRAETLLLIWSVARLEMSWLN